MTENIPTPPAVSVPATPVTAVIYDRRRELRVKIKSLAMEARIIRSEESRVRDSIARTVKPEHEQQKIALEAGFARLREHRVGELRRESRYSLLAYALIRGRRLNLTERKSPGVDQAKLIALVERFGWMSKEKAAALVESWLF